MKYFGNTKPYLVGLALLFILCLILSPSIDLRSASAWNDSDNAVSILLNTTPIVSSGEFCPKTDFGTGSNPESVAVGDFNGDGKLDLAVANDTDNTVSILL